MANATHRSAGSCFAPMVPTNFAQLGTWHGRANATRARSSRAFRLWPTSSTAAVLDAATRRCAHNRRRRRTKQARCTAAARPRRIGCGSMQSRRGRIAGECDVGVDDGRLCGSGGATTRGDTFADAEVDRGCDQPSSGAGAAVVRLVALQPR